MFKKIDEIDQKLSQKLRLAQDKKILRAAASFLAHSGDSWFWLAALFIIWIFAKGQTHTLAALFAGAIVFQAALVLVIKFTIKRRRPEGEWGAVYRNADPHSFPSGHAVRAIMLATLAWGLGLSPLCWILTIWAPLVSLARVSLGVHYLSDVVAGWLMGIVLAVIVISAQPLLYQFFPFVF
jgi:undecaprenyl-diphosphatase